ncbi:MAG: hypothetical protein JXB62_14425 [Pirellulales bacterium]|nr:hypothetical protein [Pirellulales bacterium]
MTMKPRGTTLLEVVTAGALLAAVMLLCLQLTAATATGNRALDHRLAAIREAANLMERLATIPWDDLTPQTVQDAQLGEAARDALPGATVQVDLTTGEDQPAAKRIAVVIGWHERAGQPVAPVRLVAWRYREITLQD